MNKESYLLKAKSIKYYEFGNPLEVLKFENKTIKPPQAQEIIVRMLARPINPSDLIPIWGKYAHRISLPTIPGYEGVGIIEDVGPQFLKILSVNVYYLYEEMELGRSLFKQEQNFPYQFQIQ